MLVASQYNGAIVGPIAKLLGYIMNSIFEFCGMFGIANIGLSIILFTIIVKVLLLPLSIKQQKTTKLNSVIQPEIQLVQKKYKGKTDQASQIKMNEEIQAVYKKYGTSPTSGCLPLLIQMPIIFGLYRVIYSIPGYVTSVKDAFMVIVNELLAKYPEYANAATTIGESEVTFKALMTSNVMSFKEEFLTNTDKIVDMLYNFDKTEWSSFVQLFPDLSEIYATQIEKINDMNLFLGGINLAETPMTQIWPAVLIPILAGLTQYLSVKLMDTMQKKKVVSSKKAQEDDPMAGTMKTMNTIMPLMSVFFCFTFSCGIGVYWIASSVVQVVIQFAVNKYMDTVDINDMIQKNQEKMNQKRAKQGLAPQKFEKSAVSSVKMLQEQIDAENAKEEARKVVRQEQIKKSTAMYGNQSSLAAKAGMVQKYNETHKK